MSTIDTNQYFYDIPAYKSVLPDNVLIIETEFLSLKMRLSKNLKI